LGELNRIECLKCHYTTEGSAGTDAGFSGTVETMICRTDHELVDVLTWSSGYNSSSEVGTCHKCKGTNLERWDLVERPCPKCSEPMRVTSIGIWD
jgi:hypothetical protein